MKVAVGEMKHFAVFFVCFGGEMTKTLEILARVNCEVKAVQVKVCVKVN